MSEVTQDFEEKDYLVKIQIKNAHLYRAMKYNNIFTAAELSRLSGINQSLIGKYLSLSEVPLKPNGDFKESIEKIAIVLKTTPESLFPIQHINKVLEKNKAEFEASMDDIQSVMAIESSTPETLLSLTNGHNSLSDLINSMNEREKKILELRFYDDNSLKDVGKKLGISGQRVRQLEARALAKLKVKIKKDAKKEEIMELMQ